MSKTVLMIVGVLAVIAGIIALIPSWTWETVPAWYAWLKIVIGVVCVYVASSDKSEA